MWLNTGIIWILNPNWPCKGDPCSYVSNAYLLGNRGWWLLVSLPSRSFERKLCALAYVFMGSKSSGFQNTSSREQLLGKGTFNNCYTIQDLPYVKPSSNHAFRNRIKFFHPKLHEKWRCWHHAAVSKQEEQVDCHLQDQHALEHNHLQGYQGQDGEHATS